MSSPSASSALTSETKTDENQNSRRRVLRSDLLPSDQMTGLYDVTMDVISVHRRKDFFNDQGENSEPKENNLE